jgi:hypothetical protein
LYQQIPARSPSQIRIKRPTAENYGNLSSMKRREEKRREEKRREEKRREEKVGKFARDAILRGGRQKKMFLL